MSKREIARLEKKLKRVEKNVGFNPRVKPESKVHSRIGREAKAMIKDMTASPGCATIMNSMLNPSRGGHGFLPFMGHCQAGHNSFLASHNFQNQPMVGQPYCYETERSFKIGTQGVGYAIFPCDGALAFSDTACLVRTDEAFAGTTVATTTATGVIAKNVFTTASRSADGKTVAWIQGLTVDIRAVSGAVGERKGFISVTTSDRGSFEGRDIDSLRGGFRRHSRFDAALLDESDLPYIYAPTPAPGRPDVNHVEVGNGVNLGGYMIIFCTGMEAGVTVTFRVKICGVYTGEHVIEGIPVHNVPELWSCAAACLSNVVTESDFGPSQASFIDSDYNKVLGKARQRVNKETLAKTPGSLWGTILEAGEGILPSLFSTALKFL